MTTTVDLYVLVRFENVGGQSWMGGVAHKTVDIPISPFIGMTWCDDWPEDDIQVSIVRVTPNEQIGEKVSCHCEFTDDCKYGSRSDIEKAYEEAGWIFDGIYDKDEIIPIKGE